jgi:integrative and conjugative element protein (TIGR02256 family)
MKSPPAIWLPQSVWFVLVQEANRMAPLETGGLLTGYATDDGELVITGAVGPGPNAIHERYRFVPDYDFHECELARLYSESGRRLQYLGDWHTHPGGGATLSDTDRTALKNIAQATEARNPRPVMLILAPGPEWQAGAWRGAVGRRKWFRRQLTTWPLELRWYEVGNVGDKSW